MAHLCNTRAPFLSTSLMPDLCIPSLRVRGCTLEQFKIQELPGGLGAAVQSFETPAALKQGLSESLQKISDSCAIFRRVFRTRAAAKTRVQVGDVLLELSDNGKEWHIGDIESLKRHFQDIGAVYPV